MKDAERTQAELIRELEGLRAKVSAQETRAAEQKRTEQALRDGEAAYRSMMEASPVAILGIRNERVLFANTAAARMFGYSEPGEILGTSVMDVVAPESHELVRERIKRINEKKDNPMAEITLCRPDGSRSTVESISVSVTIDGLPTAVIMAQDISERKRSGEKLEAMQFTIDHAMDRIGWIGPDGRFLYANIAGCEEMHFSRDEILTMTISDVDPNFTPEEWRDHFQELKKARSLRIETSQVDGDGKTHYLDVCSNYVKFGEREFICAFGRDVTDLKRIERSLKEQLTFERLITDLSATLVGASPSNLDELINDSLHSIRDFTGVDLTFLVEFEEEGKASPDRFWSSAGPSVPEDLSTMNLMKRFPWITREVREERVVITGGGSGSERQTEGFKEEMKSLGITSAAVIPVAVEEASQGAIGMVTTGEPMAYEDELLQRMSLFANLAGLVTRRLQKHKELVRSEGQFRAFMDHSPVFAFIKGGDLRHLYANEPMLKAFGVSLEEFAGTKALDFMDPEISERVEAADRKALSGVSPAYCYDFSVDIQGETRWFYEIKFPLGDVGPNQCLGGIAIDITERKEVELELKHALEENQALRKRLEMENVLLREEVELDHPHGEVIGRSAQMKAVLAKAEQVAATDSTVLIIGETGTGKELIARQIHNLSARAKKPLVKVNCAALPATLIESELFGREKGAFTGAMAMQVGRFEFADGGTIFLDEIGELPLELQSKLLKVLQDGEFERLGSPRTISVDVRVIAATNRNLQRAVQDGQFREDLFYRLNIFPIEIPPLRDRPDDIPALTWHFAQKLWTSMGKPSMQIQKKTMELLMQHTWQGNVRELHNVLERAVILSQGPILTVELPESKPTEYPGIQTLEELEKKHIRDALSVSGGRVFGEKGAAKLLGINPKTLYSRMKKFGVKGKKQMSKPS